MGDEVSDLDREFTRIFKDKESFLSNDEELALHIIHKFNIDRDTIESMPAFDEHVKPILSRDDLTKGSV